MLEALFGKKKTPAELLRENKRLIDKAIREVDRERNGLQMQEKKLINEMKRNAKNGGQSNRCQAILSLYLLTSMQDSTKVLAKALVRNRQYVTKMHHMKANLQAVSLKITTLKSTDAMANAMKGATKAMGAMNKRMNMPALAKIMKEFEKQNMRMEQTSEMMGDTMDDVFAEDGEEEETDKLVEQVMLEIGVNTQGEMVNVPQQQVAQAAEPVEQEPQAAGVDSELEDRLNALRRG